MSRTMSRSVVTRGNSFSLRMASAWFTWTYYASTFNFTTWGVAHGNDTMFSLWNPTDTPQDIVATLYYGNASGKYTVPVHLDAQASTMIDMAMLIAEIKPDADGNVIPPSVKEGSADFASANGRHEQITLVIAAGIYNVTNATCGGGCITCCGYSSFQISPSPILCPIGESMSCSALATDCNGYSSNLGATWSSSNTSVMTVNSSGVVTGVAAGSATITANFGSVPVYSGQYCGNNSCPAGSPAPCTGGYVRPYRVEPIATASQYPPSTCSPGQDGWQRNVTNQLQYSNGSPYAHAGIMTTDNFSIGGRNDLGVTSFRSGSAVTTGDGSWSDYYFVCSSACPVSTGETDALQNWTANGLPLPHVNLVIYKCSSISIDGY